MGKDLFKRGGTLCCLMDVIILYEYTYINIHFVCMHTHTHTYSFLNWISPAMKHIERKDKPHDEVLTTSDGFWAAYGPQGNILRLGKINK